MKLLFSLKAIDSYYQINEKALYKEIIIVLIIEKKSQDVKKIYPIFRHYKYVNRAYLIFKIIYEKSALL